MAAAALAAAAAAVESGKAPVAPARINAALEAVYMSALTVSPAAAWCEAFFSGEEAGESARVMGKFLSDLVRRRRYDAWCLHAIWLRTSVLKAGTGTSRR